MRLKIAAFICFLVVGIISIPAAAQNTTQQIAERHPMWGTIQELRTGALALNSERNTHFTKADYLPLIAANVDFFKQHQNAAGAIIDPYEKVEKQYATPAFALSAAIAVRDLKRDDLLEPASRAMSFAITAIVNKTTADNHADFYIPLVIHARRMLKDRVAKGLIDKWDVQLRSLVPEKTYKETTGRMNWNLVNICGESLRRKDGLVAQDQIAAQQAYVDNCFKQQLEHFTKMGMFSDPNVPLAYDAFPRLWMEDAIADGAYNGAHREKIAENLTLGGLSTLLLFSPSGEWITGGRSSNHQWNEAEIAVIAECNAARWNAAGDKVLAGMFKRMAHLSLKSMKRWQRPSGELWVVKNFADPADRHGYESYSFHSQYNLLAVSILAIAHERADDSIVEQPIPSEYGQYVVDLRDPFHKIVAAAAGQYVVVDTAADRNFNANGLQRLHDWRVDLSPLSDSAAGNRSFGPTTAPKLALSPGIQWRATETAPWQSLASESVESCELQGSSTTPGTAQFVLKYKLRSSAGSIEQRYRIDDAGVECTETATPGGTWNSMRFAFPAMVSDGRDQTSVSFGAGAVSIDRKGGKLTLELLSLPTGEFRLEGDRIPTHNGWIRPAVAPIPNGHFSVRWRAKLSP